MRISPSQVQGYDLCKRRWAFKIIEGIPEPTSAAQQDGILGHKRVEGLLTRGDHPGDDTLGKLIQSAMRPGILPAPGPHLLVERSFSVPLAGVSQVTIGEDGERKVEGDFFYGFIDCVVPPENGRVLVTDNKFTSSLDWAKTPADLAIDAQHVGYSRAALDMFPGQEIREVEGRWIYMQKGTTRVRPVSLVRTVAQVHEAWQPIEQKSLVMLELRKRKIPAEQLEGNKEACSMYGRAGCPYRDRCSIGRNVGKFDFGSRKVFTATENGVTQAPSTGENSMAISLMEQLNAMKNKITGGPATAPAPAQPAQAAPAQPAPVAQAAPPAAAPAPAQAAPAAAPAPGGGLGTALAALQRAKGATGVNPPAPAPQAAPAQPAQAPAPAQQSLPAQAPAPAPAPTGLAAKLGLAAPAAAVATSSFDAANGIAPAQAAAAIDAAVAAGPSTAPLADAIKKPRAKKANGAPASQAGSPSTSLTVLYNVAIVKRPGDAADPVQLVDLLGPIMRQVADANGKAHWSLIEYGQGKALLAHAFDKWLEESQWKGTVYVNGRSEEAYAVKAVLDAHADTVGTGLA